MKTPAWQRKEGQNPRGGLNAKGRESLRSAGQNIKPPAAATTVARAAPAAIGTAQGAGAGARVFVASYLPKINDRLWAQDPDKDVLLLRKLETSPYDTATVSLKVDHELINTQRKLKENHARVTLKNDRFLDRNSATDWGVVKGSARISRRKK